MNTQDMKYKYLPINKYPPRPGIEAENFDIEVRPNGLVVSNVPLHHSAIKILRNRLLEVDTKIEEGSLTRAGSRSY